MRFETSVQRLLIGILVAFGTVMAAAVYWTVMGPETALRDPVNNYRLRDIDASLIRGAIVDRHDTLLVESLVGTDGFVTRRAADPSLYSLTGYSSRQYGVGGAEAAYDSILRGTDLTDSFGELLHYELLHLPRRGRDIRLTIDLSVQQAAAAAMLQVGHPGGAVIMDASTGNLLAVVSIPSVDPATLDENWPDLIKDPDTPFLNRATQGRYIPGSALSVAILTAWLIDGRTLDDVLIPTATFTPCRDLSPYTVRIAVIEACAPALDVMAAQLGTDKFKSTAALFSLRAPVTLDGFTLPAVDTPETASPTNSPAATASPEVKPEPIPDPSLLPPDPLELRSIVRSPLELALMVAAIANGGNAMQPTLLNASRDPQQTVWSPIARGGQLMAVTTAQTASAVANAMRASSTDGLAHSDVCTGTDIGATVGMSIAADGTPQAFFTGFAKLADGHTVVAALAFEGIDLTRAAEIATAGNSALCAALASFAEG